MNKVYFLFAKSLFFFLFTHECLFCTSTDPFPQWNIPLSQLEATGEYLASNHKAAAKLLSYQIRNQLENDPEVLSYRTDDKHLRDYKKMIPFCAPYDHNRLRSAERPRVLLSASIVHSPEQEFILAGCPVFPEQVTELFMYLLSGNASSRVWVSLHETGEKPSFCNDFWVPRFIKTLPLRNGWKLENSSQKVLASGSTVSAQGNATELIKTTLLFSNGVEKRRVYHLHYDGWTDRTPCPDQTLFIRLLQEMAKLNKQHKDRISSPHVPIIINCMGGVGRTGMTTIGYICYLKICGSPINSLPAMTLNIPEIIYSLKKQRPGLTDSPTHVINLYNYLGQYYQSRLIVKKPLIHGKVNFFHKKKFTLKVREPLLYTSSFKNRI